MIKTNLQIGILFFSSVFLTYCYGQAFEPGFYGVFKDEKKLNAIFEEEKKSDRIIFIESKNEFDLGLGEIRNGGRYPIYLSKHDIYPFLQQEKHRNFVVLWLGKSIMVEYSQEEYVAEYITMFKELGYKRILILGAHSEGVVVLRDTMCCATPTP